MPCYVSDQRIFGCLKGDLLTCEHYILIYNVANTMKQKAAVSYLYTLIRQNETCDS